VRALVTGGAGFLGAHVVSDLQTHGFKVTILDRLDESGNLNRLFALGAMGWEKPRFVFHNLRAALNDGVLRKLGDPFDYVIHLAGATHVDRSIKDPLSFVEDNVVGTCNLLNYVRRAGCGRFLYFSTDEVFGSAPPGTAYKEWDRYKSTNPYSASKAGAEELAVAFHNTYKVPTLITHTMNIIGRTQHPEKFVPSTIRKIRDKEMVEIHSAPNGKAGSRFYIDAWDVADGIRFVLDRGTPGDKYNIVGAREVDNLELAEMLARAMHRPLSFKLAPFPENRPGHDLRYALDGSKLAEMGWTPKTPVEEAVVNIVDWTLSNPEWL
jgi:dTDP-glucose 4,6-dehydratase